MTRHSLIKWATALAIIVAGVAFGSTTGAHRDCPDILAPAYFAPGASWKQASPGRSNPPAILIMNPASGPGFQRDPVYAATVAKARRDGATVIGYAHTSYGARPVQEVKNEIANYKAWYHVDGIFLDEASPLPVQLPYYRQLNQYIRSAPGHFTVLNPGAVPAPGYFGVGDVIVTFEGPYSSYRTVRFPLWLEEIAPSRKANLVYGTPSSSVSSVLALAHRHRVGRIYVTDGALPNPWSALPGYYDAERDKIEELCPNG